MTGSPRTITDEEQAAYNAWRIRWEPTYRTVTLDAFLAGYRAAQDASRPTLSQSEEAAVIAANLRAAGQADLAKLADIVGRLATQLEID